MKRVGFTHQDALRRVGFYLECLEDLDCMVSGLAFLLNQVPRFALFTWGVYL